MLAASSDSSDTIRSLALECGVELDDKGAAVYDHFNHQAANGASDPTLITTTAVVKSPAIFASKQPQVCARNLCQCCTEDVSLLLLLHSDTVRALQQMASRNVSGMLQSASSTLSSAVIFNNSAAGLKLHVLSTEYRFTILCAITCAGSGLVPWSCSHSACQQRAGERHQQQQSH